MSEFQAQPERPLTPEEVIAAGYNLMQYFGIQVNPWADPLRFTAALQQLDPHHKSLDSSPYLAQAGDRTNRTEKGIIREAAMSMRMLEAGAPLQVHHDILMTLGTPGESHAVISYAAQAQVQEIADTNYFVLTGSTRKLEDWERNLAKNTAPNATTEAHLIFDADATLTRNFAMTQAIFITGNDHSSLPEIMSSPLQSLREQGRLHADMSVAAVTTPLYQTYAQLHLSRIAHQFGITKTSVASTESPQDVLDQRTFATYLYEIIQTLCAATDAIQAQPRWH